MFTIYNEREWRDVLKKHPLPSEEIKEEIWAKTRPYSLPLVEIGQNDADSDFDALSRLDSNSLIKEGEVFTRYEYNWDIGRRYIDSCNIGNKSSNFYHQDLRFKCDSINSPSPYRTWNNKKFFFTMLSGLWSLRFKKVDSDTLRQCIALRKYIASQFRPSAAKAVYEHFKAKRVLDFSSGWGDRLSAALATKSVCEYNCIDPNLGLRDGYSRQISNYVKSGKTINQYFLPAEEALSKIKLDVDLVFTSPPYFIIERYSKEETQSWMRYKKLDRWLNSFLFPCLKMSWSSLRSGGVMAINISDVYCNHTINKICDPMNDYISSLSGVSKIDNLNYRMAKRINSNSNKKGIFVEPIWCWRKI